MARAPSGDRRRSRLGRSMSPHAPRHHLARAALAGAGMPDERLARIAARRAFVNLKQTYLMAVDTLPGPRAEWLRFQIHHAPNRRTCDAACRGLRRAASSGLQRQARHAAARHRSSVPQQPPFQRLRTTVADPARTASNSARRARRVADTTTAVVCAVVSARPGGPGQAATLAEAVGFADFLRGARAGASVANSLRALRAALKQIAARQPRGALRALALGVPLLVAAERIAGSPARLWPRCRLGSKTTLASPPHTDRRGDFCRDEEVSRDINGPRTVCLANGRASCRRGARPAPGPRTQRASCSDSPDCLNVAPIPQGVKRSELATSPGASTAGQSTRSGDRRSRAPRGAAGAGSPNATEERLFVFVSYAPPSASTVLDGDRHKSRQARASTTSVCMKWKQLRSPNAASISAW